MTAPSTCQKLSATRSSLERTCARVDALAERVAGGRSGSQVLCTRAGGRRAARLRLLQQNSRSALRRIISAASIRTFDYRGLHAARCRAAELDAHGGDASLRRMVEAYVARHGELLTMRRRQSFVTMIITKATSWLPRTRRIWRVTEIIDVDNAVAGDPLLDIAKTDYYSIKEHAAKREGLLAGYGRAAGALAEPRSALQALSRPRRDCPTRVCS